MSRARARQRLHQAIEQIREGVDAARSAYLDAGAADDSNARELWSMLQEELKQFLETGDRHGIERANQGQA